MLATRRLPGIVVDAAPLPPVEALPRMDVAVFVGFAETGPLHVPVAIEGVGEYARVFGGDTPLAWDDVRGERVFAYLAPAVRAFFASGGRLCWVVRVARVDAARTNVFEVPGVLSVKDGRVERAKAEARCAGSWSDVLRVATALVKPSVAVEGIAALGSPSSDRIVVETRAVLRPGDLIELGDPAAAVAYGIVERSVAGEGTAPNTADVRLLAAFERATDAPPAAVPDDVERGRWVRTTSGPDVFWTRIDTLQQTTAGRIGTGARWRERGAELPAGLWAATRLQVLTLDVRVSGRDVWRLTGMGLTPEHTAAWWANISDAAFYPGADDVPRAERRPAPDGPGRFPLCAASEPTPDAWIPLGVGLAFGPAVPPLAQAGTPLERDGLAEFGADLFLDPELAETPLNTLLELADGIRYRRHPGRALRGIHAALSIGGGGPFTEASLLAVPDAVHVGWRRRDEDRYIPGLPAEPPPPAHWRNHRGPCAAAGDVRAPLDGPDFGRFLDCGTRAIAAPVLSGPTAPVRPGAYPLSWTPSEPGAVYELLESTQPDFAQSRVLYRGADTQHVALSPREGVYYLRVFAEAGDERSAGSNVVVVRVRADEHRQVRDDEIDAELERQWLAVHRAALRLSAASGELLAVLAMPRHFRTPDALRYTGRLRASFTTFEERALSYGALYFPWLQSAVRPSAADDSAGSRPNVRAPRVVPPDGSATGVLAARASERGAWIAPANEPLRDVVALTPVVPSADWQALQDVQVNLVRDDPRGFLALSADTLWSGTDLRPINVRRLLTLLRRLALRRGASYVFEPNGPALRRAVQRGFEILLGDLFRRGAFAGARPADGFRVVADDTVNTPRDAEAGRFFVELRVAPSVPARFIAVRLAQNGPRLAVSEEL